MRAELRLSAWVSNANVAGRAMDVSNEGSPDNAASHASAFTKGPARRSTVPIVVGNRGQLWVDRGTRRRVQG